MWHEGITRAIFNAWKTYTLTRAEHRRKGINTVDSDNSLDNDLYDDEELGPSRRTGLVTKQQHSSSFSSSSSPRQAEASGKQIILQHVGNRKKSSVRPYPQKSIDEVTHSPTHPFTHPPTIFIHAHPYTHSPIPIQHAPTPTHSHPLTHTPTHTPTHSSNISPLTHLPTHPLTYPPNYLLYSHR